MDLFETLGNALRPEIVTKKLFYVVEAELEFSDGEGITTGNKNITVYQFIDNHPNVFAYLECTFKESSENVIQGFLNDNGFGDEKFEMINL